jgi:hypothetical protein
MQTLPIQVILEALMVGIYTLTLYAILHFFIQNKYLLLYTLGFLKHFLSYYLGIHDFYCNNGYACKKILDRHDNSHIKTTYYTTQYKAQNKFLIIESLLEGVWFLIAGTIVTYLVNKNKWFTMIFALGFVTHLISEIFYIHGYFCNYNCRINIK